MVVYQGQGWQEWIGYTVRQYGRIQDGWEGRYVLYGSMITSQYGREGWFS